jgi:protoheme IX farnesyltransferase
MKLIRSYYLLCKPNVVYMMLICALVGMLLAEDSVSSISTIIIALLGIALCSGSAAAINQVIDRNADAAMTRTDQRPLPQGELSVFHASSFAFVIGVLGALILYVYINTLTMILTLASLIGYAFIYTVYLKRATPQNIVIGGLAGAAPPLLGWAAISNTIDPYALLLVLIIFVWTPPHFWALAIYRKEEYAKESIPMLPVTHGVAFTKLQIVLYTIILFIVSVLPYIVLMSGFVYLISAIVLSSIFMYYSIKLYFSDDDAVAMKTFNFSIYYIFLIFIALLCDHYLNSMKAVNKNLIIILVFMVTVLSLFINKLTTPRTLSNDELLINGLFLFDTPKEISDFEFFSSDGNSITRSDLIGKWTLMYFGFTKCPDECPTTMYQLSKLIKVLRDKDFNLNDKQWILVSIDPERDTPEIIDNYAKGFDKDFIGVSNT